MNLKSLLFTIAVCSMTLLSCSNSEKSTNDTIQKSETSENVIEAPDTCNVDTTCNDSIVTRGGTASDGFGRCLQSGCYCKSFEGRGQTCRNCGHAYKKHY